VSPTRTRWLLLAPACAILAALLVLPLGYLLRFSLYRAVPGRMTVEPGATLAIRVDGLPARPFSERLLRWGAGLVVLALALWAFLVVILGGGREARPRADAIARRKELAVKRDRLYDELVALERGRAAGRVDETAYARQRAALVAKLTLCHRELDDLDAGRRPEPGAATKA
jgi:hypothetical protein